MVGHGVVATYLGRCDDWSAENADMFWNFDDTRIKISYRTFRKYIGPDFCRELNSRFKLPIHSDHHVQFYRGVFDGKPVVCLMHSRHHYLWQLAKN